jgi:hypothetical protein
LNKDFNWGEKKKEKKDTKEVIKSHTSKRDRQYNSKKDKGQTMIYKTLNI